MPTSHYTQIPAVIEALIDAHPSSLLEVGIGCGKWGVLAREYLEVWDHYAEPWGARHTHITGIELHDLYSDSPAWAAYDNVLIGDARDIVPTLNDVDCALLVDVLEHFSHEEGERLLKMLLDKAPSVIIAIPTTFFPTIEVWDNPHEIHHCAWTLDEFRTLGDVRVYRDADSLVLTLSWRAA